MDLSLSPGAQSEKITVTSTFALLQTTNAILGGTLSNQTVNNLPPGRR